MACACWPRNGLKTRTYGITVISRFQTRNRRVDLDQPAPASFRPESAATLREYLKPTDLLPTDGIVKATADRITRGHSGDLAQARAIYEWVVETPAARPPPEAAAWATCAMLTANDLNGKCADINALFVALARRAGIPRATPTGCAGRSQLGCKAWARPATSPAPSTPRRVLRQPRWCRSTPDVRKVMLEEPPGELPINNPQVRAARVMLFGAWEMNWWPSTTATTWPCPAPASAVRFPDVSQLAGTAAGRMDSLDPDSFRYRLTARQLPGLAAADRPLVQPPPLPAIGPRAGRAAAGGARRLDDALKSATGRTGRPGPRPRRR